jgi:hypothetical protein
MTDFCEICLAKTHIAVKHKGFNICGDCVIAIIDKFESGQDPDDELEDEE